MTVDYTVVIPTIGRATLAELLRAIDHGAGPPPREVIVVDDRTAPSPLPLPGLRLPLRTVRSHGSGPAAARNRGWQAARSEWIAFLDDDVTVSAIWRTVLAADLRGLSDDIAGSQARLHVPLPAGRRPTDAERGTAGLAGARWITADMAYRRSALADVGGFDEQFRRAYREDADLALRLLERGRRIVHGARVTTHPPATGTLLSSVRAQAGNADDVLMRRKHGPQWRTRIGDGPGRLRSHAVTTAALLAALADRRALAVWAALTAEFAARRIAPGPRTPRELGTVLLTSALIPPVACWHRLRGELRHRPRRPAALLFDRDDTLIVDVPYLADPAQVRPVPGAAAVLNALRARGIRVGVVSNQSGVARGLIAPEELDRVNRRVHELLGPFDTWQQCLHGPADGCDCRKPRPGMIVAAARDLGVAPSRCVVVGDIGADVAAAQAAGAHAVLVPTARTLPDEIEQAPRVAPDLATAVADALRGCR